MRLTLVRNATLLLELGGRRLLVDPLLAEAGAYPAIANTANQRPNPLVPLPRPAEELVSGLDGVLVTHLHNDHFDPVAARLLPKDLPLLCQPGDEEALRGHGFEQVEPVADRADLAGIEVARADGRHGHGEEAEALGPVSGFVLRADGEPSLYVAGDTVWCPEVAAALETHRPDVTVVNGSGARFLDGQPIVMTVEDVASTCEAAPWTRVVVVHLEALNHCPQNRADVRAAGLPVDVPEDGETLEL